MLKYFLIILSLVFVLSCGKNADEKTEAAILSANIALSKGNCVDAINGLEGIGRQNSNARYLKTLASAYACRAGFSVVTFFASDIGKSATPAPFGGTTLYSTSQAAITGTLDVDPKFLDLQTSINILLYAGGISTSTEPSASVRANYFSANEAADINSQLVFMLLAQMGKYMHYYADASTTGVKGSGIGSNVCFTDYTNLTPATVNPILLATGGACNTTTSPHPQLKYGTVSNAVRQKRMCQGVVLLNNILDVLPSVMASASGGDLATIAALTTNINNAKTALLAAYPAAATVATVLSQYNCENDPAVDKVALEFYFAVIYEALIQ